MRNPELKEVLPYIPYDVKAKDEHGNLRTVTIEHQTYDQNTVGINHVLCNGLFFKRHTLVLRPISDLTEYCEDLGFVPIEKLFEIKYPERKSNLKHYYYDPQINYIRCSHYGTTCHLVVHINEELLNRNDYWLVQKLLEWHFKIFA